jgi:hypothetical protein
MSQSDDSGRFDPIWATEGVRGPMDRPSIDPVLPGCLPHARDPDRGEAPPRKGWRFSPRRREKARRGGGGIPPNRAGGCTSRVLAARKTRESAPRRGTPTARRADRPEGRQLPCTHGGRLVRYTSKEPPTRGRFAVCTGLLANPPRVTDGPSRPLFAVRPPHRFGAPPLGPAAPLTADQAKNPRPVQQEDASLRRCRPHAHGG